MLFLPKSLDKKKFPSQHAYLGPPTYFAFCGASIKGRKYASLHHLSMKIVGDRGLALQCALVVAVARAFSLNPSTIIREGNKYLPGHATGLLLIPRKNQFDPPAARSLARPFAAIVSAC